MFQTVADTDPRQFPFFSHSSLPHDHPARPPRLTFAHFFVPFLRIISAKCYTPPPPTLLTVPPLQNNKYRKNGESEKKKNGESVPNSVCMTLSQMKGIFTSPPNPCYKHKKKKSKHKQKLHKNPFKHPQTPSRPDLIFFFFFVLFPCSWQECFPLFFFIEPYFVYLPFSRIESYMK